MTIAVDCRMLDASGVGVYLKGCLPLFLQSIHNFLLLGNTKHLRPFEAYGNARIIPCNIKSFSLKEFFFPPRIIRQINRAQAYFSPFFNIPRGITIPVCTVIHDIIFPDMPELVSKTGLKTRMWFYRRAYKKSAKIFTVSEFSKTRIEYHLGKTKPVIVAHSAIQSAFLKYRNTAVNIPKKETIVFIGNIKKHKGLDCLLDAFIAARNEGLSHKLIIIGSKENFRTADNTTFRKIESTGNNAVSFTGFITDEQLMEYVSAAALLIQPTLYEGFCLPPLEALVLGTPALISDIPVLKEIYSGFPVTFFRADDAIDLKCKMQELLHKNERPELNTDLLSKYTFEKTASVILKELEAINT